MTGTRSKGALALALTLAAFLLADLYKAEFGTPQNDPVPVRTPTAPGSQPTFTQTLRGVTTPAATRTPAYGYSTPGSDGATGFPSPTAP